MRFPSVLTMDLPAPVPFSNVGDCELVYIWLKVLDEVLVLSLLALTPLPSIPRTQGSSESLKLLSKVGHVEEGDVFPVVASRLRTFGGCGKEAILTDRRTSLLPDGFGSRAAALEIDRMVGTVGVDLV